MTKSDQKLSHAKRARDLTSEDLLRLISQFEWGASLGAASLDRLAESCMALDFRRRRFLYRAGDPADSLFAIVTGRIKLCRIEQSSDREAVIDILSEGSLF